MNTAFFRFTLICFACLIYHASFSQTDTITIKEVTVTEQAINIAESYKADNSVYTRKATDAGKLLQQVAGLSITKRGHYALEPVIHSFRYEQLNIQFNDGVQVAHACPNRMDPITAQIAPEDIEQIEIIKGPFSVRYGQTMGGIINLKTRQLSFTETPEVSGELEGGYAFNGKGKSVGANIHWSNQQYTAQLSAGIKDYENYKAGNEQEIYSSFSTSDYAFTAGYKIDQKQQLKLNWSQSFGRDIRFAGLPMDNKLDNSSILALDYQYENVSSKLFSIHANLYGSDVFHIMNNDLRPNYAAVQAEATISSNTYGGKLEMGYKPLKKMKVFSGFDAKRIAKDGERVRQVYTNICTDMSFDPPKSFTDLIWQDAYIDNVGAFTEINYSFSDKFSLVAGARIDHVNSRAKNPADDLLAIYPELSGNFQDLNTSFTANIVYSFYNDYKIQLLAGRGTRSASLAERYINHFTIGMDAHEYVGNPYLKPEMNNQVNLAIKKKSEKLEIGIDLFYSYLNDYIIAAVDSNLPRKYMPCMMPEYAKRYRNVDEASQIGFDINFNALFLNYLQWTSNLTYVRARNLSWDEPLPEIPPLQLQLSLYYTREKLQTGLRGIIAGKQDQVSPSFSETQTPAYQVVNAFLNYALMENLNIKISIENIFDTLYYDHLSRAYKNLAVNSLFYEPGRNVSFGVNYKF